MNSELSKLIKEERMKKELSQRELARIVGIDNATISRIEKGTIKRPTIEVLSSLSGVLDINFHKLIEMCDYNINDLIKSINQARFDRKYIKNNVSDVKLKKYISTKDEFKYVDVIKVLEGYKDDKLTINETLALIYSYTPIDLGVDIVIESEKGDIFL